MNRSNYFRARNVANKVGNWYMAKAYEDERLEQLTEQYYSQQNKNKENNDEEKLSNK